jgi:hypothetical protein
MLGNKMIERSDKFRRLRNIINADGRFVVAVRINSARYAVYQLKGIRNCPEKGSCVLRKAICDGLKTVFFSFRFVSFRFVSFRFVSFRFVSFRFVSFRFVSFRFVSFCFVSFRFVSFRFVSFRFVSTVSQ